MAPNSPSNIRHDFGPLASEELLKLEAEQREIPDTDLTWWGPDWKPLKFLSPGEEDKRTDSEMTDPFANHPFTEEYLLALEEKHRTNPDPVWWGPERTLPACYLPCKSPRPVTYSRTRPPKPLPGDRAPQPLKPLKPLPPELLPKPSTRSLIVKLPVAYPPKLSNSEHSSWHDFGPLPSEELLKLEAEQREIPDTDLTWWGPPHKPVMPLEFQRPEDYKRTDSELTDPFANHPVTSEYMLAVAEKHRTDPDPFWVACNLPCKSPRPVTYSRTRPQKRLPGERAPKPLKPLKPLPPELLPKLSTRSLIVKLPVAYPPKLSKSKTRIHNHMSNSDTMKPNRSYSFVCEKLPGPTNTRRDAPHLKCPRSRPRRSFDVRTDLLNYEGYGLERGAENTYSRRLQKNKRICGDLMPVSKRQKRNGT